VILSLDSDDARDPARAGGKGSSLARLRAAGFLVPQGFVVTADEGASDALADQVHKLTEHVGAGVRFAVRSSGHAEDSAESSFAGQYETVLGVISVDEVARAITRCFASFESARARAYQHGRGAGGRGGAVVVQRLIEAEAAGVAFTVDPVSGARDRILIDAGAGLGEAVVGGRMTPDGFVVMAGSGDIVERRIANPRPCIEDDAVRAIADLATRVQAHHGGPVDVEWAWQGGRVYLLQARPVTAIGARTPAEPPPGWAPALNTRIDPRFPLYSNGNVSEILPGCVTPLTYSLFSHGIERGFRDLMESVGSMRDVGSEPIVVGFFYHRVYLNASYFMTAADNSLGATRDTVYEDLIGPVTERHPAWQWADLLPWRLWRGLRTLSRFLALQKRLDADITACRRQYDADRQRFEHSAPIEWTSDDLAAWIAPNDDDLLTATVHIRASQFAVSSFSTLRSLTRRWLGDDNEALASSLVTGIGSIASAGPASGLYALARHAAREPTVLALFAREPDDDRLLATLQAQDDPAVRRFLQEFLEFVARFGHRGFREGEFRSPIWAEQPGAVLAQIRVHLEAGSMSPDALADRQRSIGESSRRDALAKLPGRTRWFFDAVLTSTRKHIAAREEMKDLLLRFLHLMRQVIAAAKLRLADTLDDPDDIYFLLGSEVASALRGHFSRADLADVVRQRRRDFAWSACVMVPKVQDGVARIVTDRELEPLAKALVGVPVSPGVVEGLARVVLDPTHAAIVPGEILVAPVTDVAWTPLFLRATGLVVEVGGPLSHGSIVAREYGIPAVTAVAGATRRIRSGDLVRVDGTRGIVTILSTT
jgi:rifampicin phosphotransferase